MQRTGLDLQLQRRLCHLVGHRCNGNVQRATRVTEGERGGVPYRRNGMKRVQVDRKHIEGSLAHSPRITAQPNLYVSRPVTPARGACLSSRGCRSGVGRSELGRREGIGPSVPNRRNHWTGRRIGSRRGDDEQRNWTETTATPWRVCVRACVRAPGMYLVSSGPICRAVPADRLRLAVVLCSLRCAAYVDPFRRSGKA
jgi:hypothetical protein